MKTIGNMNRVRARLLLNGYASVAAWSQAKGYLPASVRRAVRVWGERADKLPHGGVTRAIVRDLRREIL